LAISLSRNIDSILFERDSTSIVIWFKLFAAAKSWSVSMEVSLAAAVSECILGLLAYLSGLLLDLRSGEVMRERVSQVLLL
jgi:hypothetical protein